MPEIGQSVFDMAADHHNVHTMISQVMRKPVHVMKEHLRCYIHEVPGGSLEMLRRHADSPQVSWLKRRKIQRIPQYGWESLP